MIQLEGIPNLSGLVQSFDQQQLANFCRILSVTISEPDVGNDDKHTLLAKNAQQKRNASPSRAEVNQGRLSSEFKDLLAVSFILYKSKSAFDCVCLPCFWHL